MKHNYSGMYYFVKLKGFRWQIWQSYQDGGSDATGATEWIACGVKFWRRLDAERVALSMGTAFNDGVWISDGRRL